MKYLFITFIALSFTFEGVAQKLTEDELISHYWNTYITYSDTSFERSKNESMGMILNQLSTLNTSIRKEIEKMDSINFQTFDTLTLAKKKELYFANGGRMSAFNDLLTRQQTYRSFQEIVNNIEKDLIIEDQDFYHMVLSFEIDKKFTIFDKRFNKLQFQGFLNNTWRIEKGKFILNRGSREIVYDIEEHENEYHLINDGMHIIMWKSTKEKLGT